MRRVRRADSPDVLRISDSSPCAAAETSFRELDDVFVQTQTRIWLGEVLHIRFDEETTISDLLADGELLFQVSKVVWKMLLKKYVELKHSKVYIYERTSSGKSDGRYMPYPKVDSFLKICQILGLTGIDLFSPSDVVEKRDVRRVCMCIRSLSKKARLKNLNVPDFDIVTYTIAMPTDMVGWIRRNLEQSQYSSSSSNSCSPCMDSKEKHRQKNFGAHHGQHDDSESDEAESTYREFEFQSPPSKSSYGVSKIPILVGEHSSPSGILVCDENFDKSQNEFQLDGQDQNEYGDKNWHQGDKCSAESIDSPHACPRANGNPEFTISHHNKSSESCTESINPGRTNFVVIGEIMSPLSTPKTGKQMHNVDIGCSQTCALSVDDSSNELYEHNSVDAEEAFEGENDSGSMPWNDNHGDCFSDLKASDAAVNMVSIQEFVNATVTPGQVLIESCTQEDNDCVRSECKHLLEENQNDGCKFRIELQDRMTNHSKFISNEAHENRPPNACIGYVEGNNGNNNHDSFQMHDGDLVNGNGLPKNCTSPQSGASDLILHSIDNGDCVLTVTVDSSCRNLKEGLDSKSSDEVVDAKVSSTADPDAIPNNAATIASENQSDVTHGCTHINFLFPEFQNYEEVEQCNCIVESSTNEHFVSAIREESMTTGLPEGRDIRVTNNYDLDVKTDGIDRSSITGLEVLPAIYELDVPVDHFEFDSEESYSGMKTENTDSTRSFLSTTDWQPISLGMLNHLAVGSHFNNLSLVDSASIKDDVSKLVDEHREVGRINPLRNDWNQSDSGLSVQSDAHYDHGTMQNKNDCCSGTIISDEYNGNRSKHVLLPDICPTNITKISKDTSVVSNTMIPDNEVVCTAELKMDRNGQLNHKIVGHEDEDMKADKLSIGESKTCSSNMVSRKHETVTNFNLNGVVNQLTAGNCYTLTEGEVKTELGRHKETSYDHSWKDLPVEVKEHCSKKPPENSSSCCALGESTLFTNTSVVVEEPCSVLNEADNEVCRSLHAEESCVSQTKLLSIGIGGSGQLEPLNQQQKILNATDSTTDFDTPIVLTQEELTCSTPECIFETEIYAEESSRQEGQGLCLLIDAGSNMKPEGADDSGVIKDIEECEKDLATALGSSGTDKNTANEVVRKPGKKVLKSVAGGVTLIGALFFLLHLRRKKGKDNIRKTGTLVQNGRPSPDSPIQKRVETSKRVESGKTMHYPGERLKL